MPNLCESQGKMERMGPPRVWGADFLRRRVGGSTPYRSQVLKQGQAPQLPRMGHEACEDDACLGILSRE